MKRFSVAITAAAVALAACPSWAQEGPSGAGQGPMYSGCGHMWGWAGGWGWHGGMIFLPFVMLLALVGTVALIVWLVRWTTYGTFHHGRFGCPYCHRHWHGDGHDALDILRERLARGEVGKEEFEEKRKLLGH